VRKFQKFIIAFFTFIGGLYFFLEFILPKNIGTFEFGQFHEQILKGLQVIGIMAIGLGIISIVRIHSKNILGQKKGWINSLGLLLGFFLMLAFQGANFFDERTSNVIKKKLEIERKYLVVVDKERDTAPIKPRLEALDKELTLLESDLTIKLGAEFKEKAEINGLHALLAATSSEFNAAEREALDSKLGALSESLSVSLDANVESSFSKRAVNLFNNGLFVPLGSAMFALLAFYIANAAYRSFRVRSVESFILMSAAIIVMLGQIPQGPMYVSENLPQIRLWLLKNISTPAFRAIFFGSSIAGLAMAIRIWFSLEKSPLDDSGGTE
jgi:hypothetical protein